MNADNLLFHPSAIGEIMSGTAKGWDVDKSLTCKRRLIKMYREEKYGRSTSLSNKYTEKGTRMEEEGITLYSLYRKKMFRKNKQRLQNEYFNGEIDIPDGNETIDIKCPWSLDTMPHALTDKPDSDYVYQGQCYMDLSGAVKHTVAYCLVNAPANLILAEKNKLWYKMDCPSDSNEDYLRAKIEIEKNMIFDMKQFMADNPGFDLDCENWTFNISIEERVIEFSFPKDEEMIAKIKSRIDECREWMNIHLFKTATPDMATSVQA